MGIGRREFLAGAGAAIASSAMARPIRSVLGGRLEYEGGEALPYDAEVEYLESTGTQYVDTSIFPNSQYSIECDALWYFHSGSGQNPTLFGVRLNRSPLVMFEVLQGINSYLYYQYGSRSPSIVSSYFNTRHVFTASANKLYCDDRIIITTSTTTFYSPYSLTLFSLNNMGKIERFTLAKVYGMKVWDENSNLVRDMIPVRFINEFYKLEGAMYDRVSGQLFRNQGTGSFIIGPDIS